MTYTQASSLAEAVAIAKARQLENPRTVFRGQRENWPVRCTLTRLSEADAAEANRRLSAFNGWMRRTPGLELLSASEDCVLAIAQHYGIPTPFIDVTTSVEIAAFFAIDGITDKSRGQFAYLLALDLDDLERFWKKLPDKYPCPEHLTPEVDDLWRLHAQFGSFLYAPYKDLELFYDFDRIVFPVSPNDEVIDSALVYPKRKSNLEIVLDQFFMIELMARNEKTLKSTNAAFLTIPADTTGYDEEYFPNGLQVDPTWSDEHLLKWISLPRENFDTAHTSSEVYLCISQYSVDSGQELSRLIAAEISLIDRPRSSSIQWRIALDGSTKQFRENFSSSLNRLWDGLRCLPVDQQDLCDAMAMCIRYGLALFEQSRESSHRDGWDRIAEKCLGDPIEVEFAASDGSYSRGYVSISDLRNAFAPGIEISLCDQHQAKMVGNVVALLRVSRVPQFTFTFPALAKLFAVQIAPYQVWARLHAVFFSAGRLTRFGLP